MLLRLVEEYRRGDLRVPAGVLFHIGDDEAARMIEDGVAIPAPLWLQELARETRNGSTR